MQFYRFIVFFLIASIPIQANESQHLKKLCFTTSKESRLCLKEDNSTILMPKDIGIGEHIYIMQTIIRAFVDDEKKSKLVLLSEGFEGTLLSIAQGNLLPYYREYIHGVVLKNSMANYYELCQLQKSKEHNKICMRIERFQQSLKGQATKVEVLKALSPALQMDWYASKMVLIGLSKEKRLGWEKALLNAEISHEFVSKRSSLNIEDYFPLKPKCKIEPKNEEEKVPQYFGPILRFHLSNILYRNKNKFEIKRDIFYGKDKQQSYNLFYTKNSKKNKLLIYVHGGGWSKGDKKYFHGLAKQYADKGYSVASLNYRFLDLPHVGMEEMIDDVKNAIIHIMKRSKKYAFNNKGSILMADSSGALLSYMAMSRLDKNYKIKKAVFNSLPSNLKFFSKEKQIALSGIENESNRIRWIEKFSPLSNLLSYDVPTLAIQGLEDKVVTPKHLEELEIQSVIYSDNIRSLWIENAEHKIKPSNSSLHPSFQKIELKIDEFIR